MKQGNKNKTKGKRLDRAQPKPQGRSKPSAKASRVRPWVAALGIFVVSFLLYANTLNHGFVWDDTDLIVNNPVVKRLDAETVSKIFTEDFWPTLRRGGAVRMDDRFEADRSSYYRPLVTLSYHVDYRLFDGKPAGFHWMNVFWNAATCAMVFVFVYVLFGNTVLALVTALLFSVHPVHTESVAWISGRTDILATMWSLVSLSLYVIARRRRSVFALIASLAAFALGMFSKETAAFVPLIVVLFELGPFDDLLAPSSRQPAAREKRRRVLTLLLFFGALALELIVRRQVLGTAASANTPIPPDAIGQMVFPLSIFAGYLYKVLLPLTLTIEFTVPVPTSVVGLPLVGAALVALVVWAVWRFRDRQPVLLGIAIFVLGILPVLHIIPIAQLAAERFLYLPSLGVVLIFGTVFASAIVVRVPALRRQGGGRAVHPWKISPAVATPLVIAFGLIVVVFAGQTVVRNNDWESNETLFAKAAQQAPDSPRVLVQVGLNAQQNGNLDKAIRAYEKVLAMSPEYALPNWNLALILMQQGNPESARIHLERAARAGPDYRAAYYHLARIENAAGNRALAKQHAREFLSLYDKDDPYRREAQEILGGE